MERMNLGLVTVSGLRFQLRLSWKNSVLNGQHQRDELLRMILFTLSTFLFEVLSVFICFIVSNP